MWRYASEIFLSITSRGGVLHRSEVLDEGVGEADASVRRRRSEDGEALEIAPGTAVAAGIASLSAGVVQFDRIRDGGGTTTRFTLRTADSLYSGSIRGGYMLHDSRAGDAVLIAVEEPVPHLLLVPESLFLAALTTHPVRRRARPGAATRGSAAAIVDGVASKGSTASFMVCPRRRDERVRRASSPT